MKTIAEQYDFDIYTIARGRYINGPGFILVDRLAYAFDGFSVECATEAECLAELRDHIETAGA
jgi:hypothetical protein